jgi:hypothetical protein
MTDHYAHIVYWTTTVIAPSAPFVVATSEWQTSINRWNGLSVTNYSRRTRYTDSKRLKAWGRRHKVDVTDLVVELAAARVDYETTHAAWTRNHDQHGYVTQYLSSEVI